ncbi:TIGR03936 family radical SAM-associated protein [Caldisericum sp. AR60]|uniref:TIGR03936 family radical SAM-associated protein n=1 Tax=Caldisericum sp. AR60 TaxID=3397852 RepID=UPI0039FDCD7E
MRIRVNFERPYAIFYLGHLDMKTVIERGLRRSGLPLKFTEGFNKRVQLELGFPLSVGMVGEDEYFDFFLREEVDLYKIFESLTEAFEGLLVIKRIKPLPYSARSITSFEAMFTNIVVGHTVSGISKFDIENALNSILEKQEILVERDYKKKDVRKFIDKLELYSFRDPHFEILMTTLYLREGSIKMNEFENILANLIPVEFEYVIRKNTLVLDKGRLLTPFDLNF